MTIKNRKIITVLIIVLFEITLKISIASMATQSTISIPPRFFDPYEYTRNTLNDMVILEMQVTDIKTITDCTITIRNFYMNNFHIMSPQKTKFDIIYDDKDPYFIGSFDTINSKVFNGESGTGKWKFWYYGRDEGMDIQMNISHDATIPSKDRDSTVTQTTICISDSPLYADTNNTWIDQNWFETTMSDIGTISEWSINFEWNQELNQLWDPDKILKENYFHVLSPQHTEIVMLLKGKDYFSTTTTKIVKTFNGESGAGKWRLWIESNDGCNAHVRNIQISFIHDSSIPPNLCAVYNGISVELNWESPINATGLRGYNIYRDGIKINTELLSDNTYKDLMAIAGKRHTYALHSVYDNESLVPNEISVFCVLKNEIIIQLPEKVYENLEYQGKILLNNAYIDETTVFLTSSDLSEIIVPEIVTIPMDATSIQFPFTAINDFAYDEPQTVTTTISIDQLTWNIRTTVNQIPIPMSERNALIDLYYSTNGDSWINSTNWLGDYGTECSWYGIECNDTNDHIVKLEIQNNNLDGNIPDSIESLIFLEGLVIPGNIIYSLPESIGNLKYIQGIEASYNQLSTLPNSIGKIKSIITLSLHYNLLTSLPESIINLSNLLYLDCDSNRISYLPENFGRLSNLEDLRLEANRLESLPESFGDLSNLEFANLNFNGKLKSLPESFGNLKNLRRLYVSNNQLSALPESFGNLKNLLELEMRYNQLNSLQESFGNLDNLASLDLAYNQLSSLPDSFIFLNLSSLDLSYNKLRSLPSQFGNLSNLSFLKLESNKLDQLPESFNNLRRLSSLSLSSNPINNLLEFLGTYEKLSYLYLDNCQLTGFPENFGSFMNLKVLDLSKNQINTLPDTFVNCEKLTRLYLSENQLDHLPNTFGNLINLEELDLSSNQLLNLPDSFGNIKKLEKLFLSRNQLSQLPENIGNLVDLFELNLNSNQLVRLPDNFGNLVNLKILNLSNNILVNLPESFGRILNIIDLDLSTNQLSALPNSFGKLKTLLLLDLSENILKSLPENFGNLYKLNELNLNNNKIEFLPSSFRNLVRIQKLFFANNKLLNIPQEIFSLLNITELDLSYNEIENISENISNLKSLLNLNLSHNKFSQFPYDAGNIPNLKEFNLSYNKIHTILHQLENFTDLTLLDLSNNTLYELPKEIEKLTNLRYLYLNSSCLQAREIPPELGNLHNLQLLALSNNFLERIPKCIGNLSNLKMLYLDNNHLQGNIPLEIFALKNIRTLDLSTENNEEFLYGEIQAQFSKLSRMENLYLSGNKIFTRSEAMYDFIMKSCKDCEYIDLLQSVDPILSSTLKISKISSSTDKLSAYKIGEKIDIEIIFTEPVILVNGNLNLSLETGDIDRTITIPPFSYTKSITATYIVQDGDVSDDLDCISITQKGGFFEDSEGNIPDLSIPQGASLADSRTLIVDGKLPTVSITEPDLACVDSLYKIKGIASDNSKDYKVEIAIINGNTIFSYLMFTTDDLWELDTSYDWAENTAYTIVATVTDFAGNETSDYKYFTYGKQPSNITCTISEQSVILGQRLTISGSISPPENVTDAGVSIALIHESGTEIYKSCSANHATTSLS